MTYPKVHNLITEKQWQQTVRDAATALGWTVFCTWRSERSPAGEPDLRLVHPVQRRVLWVELKSEKGKLTCKQAEALAILRAAGQETFCWRPSDWEEAIMVLSGSARNGKC